MIYEGMICPHCGQPTGIDPALIDDEKQTFCPLCDEQIFFESGDDPPGRAINDDEIELGFFNREAGYES